MEKRIMKYKQKGFTLLELLTSLLAIIAVAVIVGMIYVICHFLSKVW
jgi:type II secretory pathway component PulJ